MKIKTITYSELEKAIELSFMDDSKIFDFYDPNINPKTIEEIKFDIVHKVKCFSNAELRGVYEGEKLIGYFVFTDGLLISFSLNPKYRIRGFLRPFFKFIKKELNGIFSCYLWSRNTRAIGWLKKNGCEVISFNQNVTVLVCQ